jgi:DNA-binding PadR family transcriptional regulator
MEYRSSWDDRPFQKGDLKYVILGLIADKPRHGYEIIRILEERSHGFYAPSPGAVYPTLQYLEEAGYVSSSEHDGKKTYAITEEGRRFLDERKDFAEGIKKHMTDLWGLKGMGELRETVA